MTGARAHRISGGVRRDNCHKQENQDPDANGRSDLGGGNKERTVLPALAWLLSSKKGAWLLMRDIPLRGAISMGETKICEDYPLSEMVQHAWHPTRCTDSCFSADRQILANAVQHCQGEKCDFACRSC